MKVLLTLLLDPGGAGPGSALLDLTRLRGLKVLAQSSAVGEPERLAIEDWRRLAADHGEAIARGLRESAR